MRCYSSPNTRVFNKHYGRIALLKIAKPLLRYPTTTEILSTPAVTSALMTVSIIGVPLTEINGLGVVLVRGYARSLIPPPLQSHWSSRHLNLYTSHLRHLQLVNKADDVLGRSCSSTSARGVPSGYREPSLCMAGNAARINWLA